VLAELAWVFGQATVLPALVSYQQPTTDDRR